MGRENILLAAKKKRIIVTKLRKYTYFRLIKQTIVVIVVRNDFPMNFNIYAPVVFMRSFIDKCATKSNKY